MTSPIHILYVHHAIGLGGAPNSLAFLINSLDPQAYKTTILMPARDRNQQVKQLFLDAGATVVEERHIRPFNGVNGCRCDSLRDRLYAILAALPTCWAVRKHVRRIQPDIVHLNTSVLPFAAFGSRWASRKTPLVVHVRETLLTNWWGKLLGWLNRKSKPFFLGIDQNGLDSISAPVTRSTVIRNFVNRAEFNPDAGDRSHFRNELNLDQHDIVFASIARIAASNGALELARFLAEHQDQLPANAKFLICGFEDRSSEYVASTLEAIEKSPQVFAVDYTTRVKDLIAAADVIVAPFRTAHSARMVIEGAAMAKPCLVTDLPNLREQLEHEKSGFTFHFADPASLLKPIRQFCSQPELLQEMSDEASRFAAENFDDQTNARRTTTLYQQLLSQAKPKE